jgi:hypothetical protein
MPILTESAFLPSPSIGWGCIFAGDFSGHDAISRLFSFHVDMLWEQGPSDFTQIIGKEITI